MPHPAILFLVLCGAVIVLSQALYWVELVKATFEVVETAAPSPTEETYYGGSASRQTSGRPSRCRPRRTR